MVLINAVKDVAKALAELISATKCAAGKAADDPSMYQLKSAAKVSHTKGHLHDAASDHVVDVHHLIQQQPNYFLIFAPTSACCCCQLSCLLYWSLFMA